MPLMLLNRLRLNWTLGCWALGPIFVLIRSSKHEANGQGRFFTTLKNCCKVLEAYRLATKIDYILKVLLSNAKAYDAFYQGLIVDLWVFNVSSLSAMEKLKFGSGFNLEG